MKISTNPRLRLAVALGVLVGLMAVVVVTVAGAWGVAYDPLFYPTLAESHFWVNGFEVTNFHRFAVPGVIAACISLLAVAGRRPLNTWRKRIFSATCGPATLVAFALVFVTLWWAAVGFDAAAFAGMAPTLLVVLTSAVASSAGFLGAILVAQSVWAHQRQSPSAHL